MRSVGVLWLAVGMVSGWAVRGGMGDDTALRLLPCPTASPAAVATWQETARTTLFTLLQIDDLALARSLDSAGAGAQPLAAREVERREESGYTLHVIEIDARPDRPIRVNVGIPDTQTTLKRPAVICIHGHGGDRDVVYRDATVYHAFAAHLTRHGFVTLSADVGQHHLQDQQRTLMGERLWDLIRVVDYATTHPQVDAQRIGCAGLSLGGEMAMWLGAMDLRIRATVSSGFLTTMENMREGHCMCWDFPGLQRRYDFADIYGLISPRPLQCQNGELERLPGGFPVDLAQQVMAEIRAVYRVCGAEDAVELDVHPGGHVFHIPTAEQFLEKHLGPVAP